MNRLRLIVFCLLFTVTGAQAVQEVELNNLEDEPRFKELSNVLRCMVCQNQSIADSNAELARDFRNQVKEKINAGQSDKEIVDYMVQRYGDYILYKPPFNAATALLWTGPFILVVVGFFIVRRLLRRQQASATAAPDDAEQQARLRALLDNEEDRA